MGLDVQLQKSEDFEASIRLEADFAHALSKLKTLPEAARKEEISKLEKKWGIINGKDSSRILIEERSKRHPNHLFKIGYFRSSFFPGSFNAVLRSVVEEDLYSIFGVNSEPIYTEPDWYKVKEKIASIRQALVKHKEQHGGFHTVEHIANTPEPDITSPEEALQVFNRETLKYRQEGEDRLGVGNFSDSRGNFYLHEPKNVCAILPGTVAEDDGIYPCSYIVYEIDIQWYCDALDVIEETADFMLAQPDPEKYRLCWSG